MTTIAEKLTTIDGALGDIKTAIEAKGVTPSGDITTYATAIGNISGGGGSGKYQLLDRVKDDSNNEIGTVSGFFTDANDVEYAVVCLDAQYRLTDRNWCSDYSNPVTDLPAYANADVFAARETATTNTQLILDYCTAQSATSGSCSHCRSNSFIIDGVTYYGQLPNLMELISIFENKDVINTADTSSSSYSSLFLASNMNTWSSNQYDATYSWGLRFGIITTVGKANQYFVIPVLEIPNVV